MIKWREYLKENISSFTGYALVTYNGVTEATYFASYSADDDMNDWYLESPCLLYKIDEINTPIDEFCEKYVREYIELEDKEEVKDYIEKYVKPMIIDNIFYEIENFQVAPYLPEEVNEIKLISERECLEWLIDQSKNIK